MLKITNGINVLEVTKGAFDGIYSRQGYTEMAEEAEVQAEELEAEEELTEDEMFCEELLETPISKWNKEEVKRFAAIKGIDISGTKNASEAKEIIKDFVEAQ